MLLDGRSDRDDGKRAARCCFRIKEKHLETNIKNPNKDIFIISLINKHCMNKWLVTVVISTPCSVNPLTVPSFDMGQIPCFDGACGVFVLTFSSVLDRGTAQRSCSAAGGFSRFPGKQRQPALGSLLFSKLRLSGARNPCWIYEGERMDLNGQELRWIL